MRLVAIALAGALFATSSFAQSAGTAAAPPSRGIDFSTVIQDATGKAINETEAEPFTLGRASATALFTPFQDEQNLSGDEKWKRGKLGMKVRDAGVLELSPEDVALIKKVIGKAYSPLVVMRAYGLLDPTMK